MNLKIFGREIFINKITIGVIAVLLSIVLIAVGIFIKKSNDGIVFENTEDEARSILNSTTPTVNPGIVSTPTQSNADDIKVYITGCVKKPGLVTIKKGQIVDDAVKAAGGLTEDADLNFNMAYVLNENVWIVVKSRKDNTVATGSKPVTAKSSAAVSQNNNKSGTGTGVEIIKDSGGVIAGGEIAGGSNNNGRININTATADELNTLPGIGEKISKDIIAYREKNGKFKSIADIVKVPGIGESKFNKMKDLITAD